MSVRAGRLVCDTCDGVIDDERQGYAEIVGFVRMKRDQGGANAVKFQARTGTHLCAACVLRKEMQGKRGPVDGALF